MGRLGGLLLGGKGEGEGEVREGLVDGYCIDVYIHTLLFFLSLSPRNKKSKKS